MPSGVTRALWWNSKTNWNTIHGRSCVKGFLSCVSDLESLRQFQTATDGRLAVCLSQVDPEWGGWEVILACGHWATHMEDFRKKSSWGQNWSYERNKANLTFIAMFGQLVGRLTAACLLKLAQPYKLPSSCNVAAERPSAFYSLGILGREPTQRALASNPLQRVLWEVHYPRAHLFQSQRRGKKTPAGEETDVCTFMRHKFFILCRRKPRFSRWASRWASESTAPLFDQSVFIVLSCSSTQFYFPPSSSSALHSDACDLYIRLFDISDSTQRSGNIFVLFVAESTHGKKQIQHQKMSFSLPWISEAGAYSKKWCQSVFFSPCTEKSSQCSTHIRPPTVSDLKSP